MRFACGLMVCWAVAGMLGTALAWLLGGLGPGIAWGSLLAGAAAGAWAGASARGCGAGRVGFWGAAVLVAGGLVIFRMFGWVLFADGAEWKFLSANNFGDLALHIQFIRYFANGAPFWPDSPIFPGLPLHYPFGTDLLNAMLLSAGMDLRAGLLWVGFLGGAAALCALWRWCGAFGVAAFLFNGGTAGFAVISTGVWADYQTDMDWKSIPLAMFVTQRGLLYAVPAGLVLLASWRARWEQREEGRAPFAAEAALYSAMPLFHFHTFLFLSFLLGWWFVSDHGRLSRWPIKLVGAALLPASALAIPVTGLLAGNTSGMHLQPGWLQKGQPFFAYWFGNFGALLPLALLAGAAAVWVPSGRAMLRRWWAPACVMFLATGVISFSRWEWDNTKLMLWSYLIWAFCIWRTLLATAPWPFRAAACTLLFGSGFVSVVGGLGPTMRGFTMAELPDVRSVGHAVRDLPVDAVFLAHPTFNHPLQLNGRKVAMGFEGHLWSYGIAYQKRLEMVKLALMGGEGWLDAARATGATHLFWGEMEERHYPGSGRPWTVALEPVSSGDWGTIFDLESGGE